jgi:hypothetical protein
MPSESIVAKVEKIWGENANPCSTGGILGGIFFDWKVIYMRFRYLRGDVSPSLPPFYPFKSCSINHIQYIPHPLHDKYWLELGSSRRYGVEPAIAR